MKTRVLFVLFFTAVFTLQTQAQETEKRFGFEFSAGPSFATSDLADADLKMGAGFEGVFHYRILAHTGIYAGWGWNKFAADESFAGNNMDFEETGYVFGLQFKHPVNTLPISYYLRAAGLYNHIEIENSEGDIVEDTGHGYGWQLAGGVDLELGKNWSLTPGVKFNALSRELENESGNTQLELNYLQVRIGILKKF